MTVSVIMPLFNSEKFIGTAIESVLVQTALDWELIVVDDCSTDKSLEIVKSYAKKDKRIRVIALQKNSGAATTRNVAIEAAVGRYIAFLDSDDVWHPKKLEKQILFMRMNNAGLSHTFFERITESGSPSGKIVCPPLQLSYEDMLRSNQIGCLTAVYDSEKLGKILMPLVRKRQDYGLWLQILKREPYAYCVPENLARYRVRSSSISSNKVEMLKYNWLLFRRIEKLSVVKSIYYIAWNVARRVLK